jgi:hypothetical protein
MNGRPDGSPQCGHGAGNSTPSRIAGAVFMEAKIQISMWREYRENAALQTAVTKSQFVS